FPLTSTISASRNDRSFPTARIFSPFTRRSSSCIGSPLTTVPPLNNLFITDPFFLLLIFYADRLLCLRNALLMQYVPVPAFLRSRTFSTVLTSKNILCTPSP